MLTGKSFKFKSFTLDLERLCLYGPSGRKDLRRKSFDVLSSSSMRVVLSPERS